MRGIQIWRFFSQVILLYLLVWPIASIRTKPRLSSASCTSKPPVAEVQSLIALYNATNGKNWLHKWPVTTNNNPCTPWFGITCSLINSVCHVKIVLLPSNKLVGTLPSSIANITYLSELNVGKNTMHGKVPYSIGKLVYLQILDLFINQFTGPLPSSIGSLVSLQALNIYSNFFSGYLPESFGNLTSLQSFVGYSNLFSGPIPSSIGKCIHLTNLNLYMNSFSRPLPISLGRLLRLQSLDVSQNFITGQIPTTIGGMVSLSELSLTESYLSGTIPNTIGNCRNLTSLDFDTNFIKGSIPNSIGNLTWLVSFVLFQNYLTGNVPESIGKFSFVTLFDIHDNYLSGTLANSIGNLTNLIYMYANENYLHGSIPTSICELKALVGLFLGINQLSGSIPNCIGKMSSLSSLYINSNRLYGTMPSSLQHLLRLTELALYSNFLTGSIPPQISNLKSLQLIYLQDNKLSSFLPSSLGNLTSLTQFDVHDNQLTGTIPASYGNWSNIGSIDLRNNMFIGTIPSQFSAFPFLQFLYLDGNHFSIVLSEFFSPVNSSLLGLSKMYPQLIALSFNRNKVMLTAGNKKNNVSLALNLPLVLQYLDVSDSLLTGSINAWFPSYPYNSSNNNTVIIVPDTLQYLDISGNYLTGSLPISFWSTKTNQLFMHDNLLAGQIVNFAGSDTSNPANCTMEYLSLSNNYFSGSLPTAIANCSHLVSFVISNMHLSGSISGIFAHNRYLQELVISNNYFTGTIDDVFLSSNDTSNLIFNAAYNALSGGFPLASLHHGNWKALILTENCLTGSIPFQALCLNHNLTEILLSGLHSAKSCRSIVLKVPHFVYTSYVQSSAIYGSFSAGNNDASCLFTNLPSVQFIALSSNSLTGSLSTIQSLPTNLQGLDLSHNMLVGTIPDVFLMYPHFQLLDLSFNRFAGTIPSNVSSSWVTNNQSSLSLEVNLLSGKLPKVWKNVQHINILNGNLFACKENELVVTANIPVNDPLYSTYFCGSATTNIPLLIALCCVVLSMFSWLVHAKYSMNITIISAICNAYHHTVYFISSQICMYKQCLLLLTIQITSMLVYALLALYTSVYADLYIWVIACALQQGEVATTILLIWFFVWLFILFLSVNFNSNVRTVDKNMPLSIAKFMGQCKSFVTNCKYNNEYAVQAEAQNWKANIWLYGIECMFLTATILLHTLPVVVINSLYVYTTSLTFISSKQKFGIALAMAVFKLLWNTIMNTAFLPKQTLFFSQATWMAILSSMSLFNLIISPILTEIFVSPNCFKYAFTRIPSDAYAVEGGTCYWITYVFVNPDKFQHPVLTAFPCMSYEQLQETYNSGSVNGGNFDLTIIASFSNGEASNIDFQAGFAYNFQCSFSLLEAFVHIFILRYIISLFFVPVGIYICKQLQEVMLQKFYQSHSDIYWKISNTFTSALPILYRFIHLPNNNTFELVQKCVDFNTNILQSFKSNNHTPVKKNMLDSQFQVLHIRIVSDIAVALSFGILFPPLGILALTNAIWEAYRFYWLIDYSKCILSSWQKYKDCAISQTLVAPLEDVIHMVEDNFYQCQALKLINFRKNSMDVSFDTWSVSSTWRMICHFAAVLWAFACYDILGRAVGASAAIWVLLFVVSMPWWVYCLAYYSHYYYYYFYNSQNVHTGNGRKDQSNSDVTEVELGELHVNNSSFQDKEYKSDDDQEQTVISPMSKEVLP